MENKISQYDYPLWDLKKIVVKDFTSDERLAIFDLEMFRWRYYLMELSNEGGPIVAKELFLKEELELMKLNPKRLIVCWSYNNKGE